MSSNDLKSHGGSFQTSKDRAALLSDIAEGSRNFKGTVKRHEEEAQRSLKDITSAESSGDLTPEQRRELGLPEVSDHGDGFSEEPLLGDLDVSAEKKGTSAKELSLEYSQANAEMHKPYASGGEEEEEESVEEYTVLDDGTKICNTCSSVVHSPSLVEIEDEELVNYMMGSPIVKDFLIGPIKIIIRSINERELDYCGELMARDRANDEFPTDIEYENRFSFYRLCFALVAFGRKKDPDRMVDPSASKGKDELESNFAKKSAYLKGIGHILRIKMNRKQQILETSISIEMENEERLKNL